MGEIVFILHCQKVQKQLSNCLKSADTIVVSIFSMMSSEMSEFILLPFFFTVALCETDTRKAFLGPWLNKTEVYLTPFLVHKITQLQDNWYYLTLCKLSFEIQESSLSDITCLIQYVVSPHRGEKRMSRCCMRCPLSDFFFRTSWYWNAGNDVQRKQKKVQCTFIQTKKLFNVHLFDRLMYHESVILPLPRASL
jgi:hypothetical protein